MSAGLVSSNTPAMFWRLMVDPPPSEAEWVQAIAESLDILPPGVRSGGHDLQQLLARTLGEEQFGPNHWTLSRARRLYYQVKPLLPRRLTRQLRQLTRSGSRAAFPLGWPVEDRYARFLWALVSNLLRQRAVGSFPFIDFWPGGQRFALVLTHDVETAAGQEQVLRVADLEAQYGFRSSFNFVPERYRIDGAVIAKLRERGFEIGVHGLTHDGKLFSSQSKFMERAKRINQHLRAFGAQGFRSPLTHRNPAWMQAIDMAYDLSFFDTDPFEPMPGGTMSLWPFQIGRFIELPYTLPQDYTLTAVLEERSPRIWLMKLDTIEAFHGMALVNTHPDYLADRRTWTIYEQFLRALSERKGYWHALPAAVADWWSARRSAASVEALPGAVRAYFGPQGIKAPTIGSREPRLAAHG